MVRPSPIQVALGVGSSGALVDVSSYVQQVDEEITRTPWRSDQFDEAEPGTFSFVLDNADGRFTPDNSLSALSTTLSEGSAACWRLGDRLVAGTVRSIEPVFPDAEAAWAAVSVTCDDLLGQAARRRFTNPLWGMADGQGVTSHFPFDDLEGSTVVGNRIAGEPSLVPSGDVELTFEVEPHAEWSGTQCTVDVAAGLSGSLEANSFFNGNALLGLDTSIFGSVFLTAENATSTATFAWRLITTPPTGGYDVQWRLLNLNVQIYDVSITSWVTAYTVAVGEAINVTVGIESGDVVMYVNGVQVATYTDFGTSGVLGSADATFGGAGISSVTISNLIFTPTRLLVEGLGITTEAGRINAINQMSTTIACTTPAGLSTAAIAPFGNSAASMLDAYNEVALAEQGHLYAATTGTLTSPTQTLTIRERDRPDTVTLQLGAQSQLQGAPELIRQINDLVSEVEVDTYDATYKIVDTSLIPRAGDASTSETIILAEPNQAIAWGQDRLLRGAPSGLQVVSLTVDLLVFPTGDDPTEDVLALIPGDRIRITELPEQILGFDQWDGWVLGFDEAHSVEQNQVTIYLQPVIPYLGKYDTARYAADGDLTLSAGINSSVTSMSVATSSVKFTTTDLPQTIIVDDEQMTVTAVTSATPQVFTVTRGVNGTTAASHPSGAAVEIVPTFVYGF